MSEHRQYDAVVIGGGPAGNAFAAAFARQGYSVLLLESLQFPRFHIGESLLPYMQAYFYQEGLLSKIESSHFVVKRGAEFTNPFGQFRRVVFASQGLGRAPYTYQVERKDFDLILMEHARAQGAEILCDARVDSILEENGRVRGVTYMKGGERHQVTARFVLDASGRRGVLANRFAHRTQLTKLNMVAFHKQYTGFDDSNHAGAEGDIQIGNYQNGWVWAIPIRKDKISVGMVIHKDALREKNRDALFEEYVHSLSRISKRLKGSQPEPELRGDNDFSYYSQRIHGPGYVLLGDAACFADPIFSGGVFLAAVTAREAAYALGRAIRGEQPEEEALARYDDFYKTGYDCYFRMIFAFYENNFNFQKFARALPNVEEQWIARILSGDFWSEENVLAAHLRRIEPWNLFGDFTPAYGCPLYSDPEVVRYYS